MQFLFKRSEKRQESNATVNRSRLSKIVEKGYLFVQSKWAEWMTKQTSKLSVRNQLLVFGFFIVFTSGYSIYLISTSFSDNVSNGITVTAIIKPVAFQTDDATINKSSVISKNELNKIIRFRSYIDSLARSPTGKKLLDSITDKRPGLLDSLAGIENYYQSNFKNYYHGK